MPDLWNTMLGVGQAAMHPSQSVKLWAAKLKATPPPAPDGSGVKLGMMPLPPGLATAWTEDPLAESAFNYIKQYAQGAALTRAKRAVAPFVQQPEQSIQDFVRWSLQ